MSCKPKRLGVAESEIIDGVLYVTIVLDDPKDRGRVVRYLQSEKIYVANCELE